MEKIRSELFLSEFKQFKYFWIKQASNYRITDEYQPKKNEMPICHNVDDSSSKGVHLSKRKI